MSNSGIFQNVARLRGMLGRLVSKPQGIKRNRNRILPRSAKSLIAFVMTAFFAGALLVASNITSPTIANASTTWTASALFPHEPVWTDNVDFLNGTGGYGYGALNDVAISPQGGIYTATSGNFVAANHDEAVAGNWTTGKVYYVPDSGTTMTVHDIASNTNTTVTLPVSGMWKMAVSQSRNTVYILNRTTNSLYVYNVAAGTFTTVALAAGSNPDQLALDDSANLLFISTPGASSNTNAGTVTVVSTATNTITATATVGVQPAGLTIDHADGLVYIANRTDGTVSVLSESSFTVTSSINLRQSSITSIKPTGVAYDATRDLLWFLGVNDEIGAVELGASNALYIIGDSGCAYWGCYVLQDTATMAINPVSGYPYMAQSTGITTGYGSQSMLGTISERPIITTSTLPNANYNTAYSQQLAATGLKPDFGLASSYQWSVVSGMPAGLSLSASGLLSGTPTVWGQQSIVVSTEGDAGGWGPSLSVTLPLYIVPPPPVITTTTLTNPVVGASYSAQVAATYGESWSLHSGDQLPAGLSMSATGLITGTPTTAGSYTFRVVVSNDFGQQTTTQSYTVNVTQQPPVIDPTMTWTTVPTAGKNYAPWMNMALATGSPSATWSISAGALPAGLTLNTATPGSEYIDGTVTAAVGTSYSFTIRATNPISGLYDEKSFSGTVAAVAPTGVSVQMPITMFVGQSSYFSPYVAISNWTNYVESGSQPLTWTVDPHTADQLPAGLSLASNGIITGTPTAAAATATGSVGTGQYAVTLDDSNSAGSNTSTIDITVLNQPLTFTESVSLQTGQALTPSTLYAQPALGDTAAANTWNDQQFGTNFPGNWLNFDDTMNGGGAGYFSLQYGYSAVPSNAAGNYSLVVDYTSSITNQQVYGLVSIAVTSAAPVIASTLTYNVASSSSWSHNLTTDTTGPSPYSYVISNGSSLPSWLSLTPGGALSGTAPAGPTSSTFSVDVSNSNGTTTTTVTVNTGSAPSLSTSSAPGAATTGVSYSYSPAASGGGAQTFSTTGQLPPGLTINPSTGQITGTPTTAGTYNYSIVLTTPFGSATLPQTITVTTVAPSVNPLTVTMATNTAVSQQIPVTSGSPVTSYALANGSTLPSWLTLNPTTGALTGTSGSAGTYTFNVVASNSAGSATSTVTFNLYTPVTIPATLTATGATTGVAYSYTVTPTTGTGPLTFSATGLPAGLSINPNSGVISGTPTTPGTSTATVSVSNPLGVAVTTQVSLTVTTTLVVLPATQAIGATTVSPLSATITPAGGSPATSYTVTNGTLPSPLTLTKDSNGNAVISGTPATAGVFTFSVAGVNGAGTGTPTVVTLTVTSPPVVSSTLNTPALTAGVQSSYQIPTSGSPAASSFTAAPGATVPSWVSINPTTGLVTATPPVNATSPISIPLVIGNSVGTTNTSLVLSWAIVTPFLPATSTGTGIVGNANFTFSVTPTGGSPVVSWTLATGSLPAGLSLSNGGAITGTPTTAGTSSFTLRATNSAGSSTTTVTLTIVALPVINSALNYNVAVGNAWSHDLTLDTSGTGSFSYALHNGSTLPSWLSLTPAGLLNTSTGPSSVGNSSFVLDVSNANGTVQTTVTIAAGTAPSLSGSSNAPAATNGIPYSYTPSLTGSGTPTYSYTGTLPPGLSINPTTGQLSGTPTTNGTYSFNIVASTVFGNTSLPQTITVSTALATMPATAAFSGTTLAPLTTATITQTGGSPATSYLITTGTLPSPLMLTINGNGQAEISGTPAAAGTYTFSVAGVNAAGTSTTVTAVTLTVTAPASIASTITAPTATVGSAYSYALTPSGGGTYTYSYTGTLPTGLSFNTSTGTISGTATAAGSGTINVTISNGVGSPVTTTVTVNSAVAPTIASTLTPPAATVSQPYSYTVSPTGTGPFTFSATGLPPGLSINPTTGAITGTPTAGGSSSIHVTITGPGGSANTTLNYTATVAAPVLPATLALSAVVGQAYSYTVTPTGGSAASSFTFGGTLPAGLTPNTTTGQISGTPTTAGVSTATVTATNSGGTSATLTITMTVTAAPSFGSGSLTPPGALYGQAYSYTVTPAGTGPFTFAVVGTLPTGLILNPSTGQLSGTPTATGTSTFSVTATNSAGTATVPVTLSVNQVPTFPVSNALPIPVVAQSYTASIGVTGTGPIAYSVSAGSLPAGLTLNPSTGAITGTPTATGTSSFSVTATSSFGTAVQPYSLTVSAANAPTFTSTAPTTATVGTAFTTSAPAVGAGSFTFSISSGSLPPGLTLNPTTGVVSGTPTTAGVYSYTVTATNSAGSAAQSVSLAVVAPAGSMTASTNLTIDIAVGQTADGAPATATGAGLLPGSTWVITLHSTPTILATGTVPSNGVVSQQVTLPASIAAGSHTLIMNATSATGSAVTAQAWLAVDSAGTMAAQSYQGPVSLPASGSLASTGTNIWPILKLAIVLLEIGVMATFVARRRRQLLQHLRG